MVSFNFAWFSIWVTDQMHSNDPRAWPQGLPAPAPPKAPYPPRCARKHVKTLGISVWWTHTSVKRSINSPKNCSCPKTPGGFHILGRRGAISGTLTCNYAVYEPPLASTSSKRRSTPLTSIQANNLRPPTPSLPTYTAHRKNPNQST